MKAALGLAAALVILVAVALSPLPIRPYLDFQVIYHTDLGLLQGISIYDHAGQINMIARLANVEPEQVFVIPFPYPPWYALATVWLALLPIDVAARLWFGLNLIMLGLSLWLLTEGLPGTRRAMLCLAAIAFPPVLGSLFVGQYIFPVLLGTALLVRALRRSSPWLVAASAALLTFKPHLGIIILLIAAVYLWQHRADLGRRALPGLAGMAGVLFLLGFAASPLWPINYFRSLTGFQGVSQCHQCVNLPMALAGLAGAGFGLAPVIAAIILVLLGAWLVRAWAPLAARPMMLVGAAVLVTLLASPYLQNYDYVLLIVPFIGLADATDRLGWILLGLAFIAPIIGIGAYGAAGSQSLVPSSLLLLAQMTRDVSFLSRNAPTAPTSTD